MGDKDGGNNYIIFIVTAYYYHNHSNKNYNIIALSLVITNVTSTPFSLLPLKKGGNAY